MEKHLKTEEQIEEEDEKLFLKEFPADLEYLTISNDFTSSDLPNLERCTSYLLDRIPNDFISRELLFNISEVDSLSSLSEISEDELEEVGYVRYNDEVTNKTLRQLFYELVIEKQHHKHKIKPSSCIKDGLEDRAKEVDNDENQEINDKANIKLKSGKKRFSIMESDSEEIEQEDIIFHKFRSIKRLLEEDTNDFEDHLYDAIGCKSLKTVLDDASKSKRNADYHINNVISLFKYDSHQLNNKELSIEIEIADTINNLNNNTIKPENNLYSLITGCVVAGDGVGILNLEISLYDLIRLILSVNWSMFKQKVTEIRVLSTITDISPIFETFTICKAFLIKNDTRQFPKNLKIEMRQQKKIKIIKAKLRKRKMKTKMTNDEVYLKKRLRYIKNISKRMGGYRFNIKNGHNLPNIRKFKKKIKKIHFKHSLHYLNEISQKLGYTFKLLKHQSKAHPCGMAELPPCAAQHLPSKNIILWALKCNYLKKWEDFMSDILQPKAYFDSTNDSYPAPSSLINFHHLDSIDRNKNFTKIMHVNGFHPKFSENNRPELVLPRAFFNDSDEVFKNTNVKFININDNQLNVLSEML